MNENFFTSITVHKTLSYINPKITVDNACWLHVRRVSYYMKLLCSYLLPRVFKEKLLKTKQNCGDNCVDNRF